MAKIFENGQKLSALFFPNEHNISVGKNVLDIEVVMECGQMSGVPWAYVTYADGQRQKWNLALCEGVLLPVC